MELMDIDSDRLENPDVKYDSIVKMLVSEFTSICSSLATIGDTVTISVSKQGVTFSTKGDIGTGKITCRSNTSTEKPKEATVIEMKEPIMLTFALKYITLINKASTLSSQLTVSLCTDMPMVVEYKVAEMSYIRYYLAPKIEEDELESNPQAETRAQTKTRARTENPENQMEPEVEEAIPLHITPTNEEIREEAENVEVKMET